MNGKKILNLAGGKVLYDDLRERIEALAASRLSFESDQDLNEEQREQARNNIDAVSMEQMDAELSAVDNSITALKGTNSVKLCDSTQPENNTDSGVTFVWTGNSKCVVTGTPTNNAISKYCARAKPLPTDEVEVGGSYFVYYRSSGSKCRARASWFIDNPGGFPREGGEILTKSQMFTVPAGATSFSLQVYVPSGSGAVNETVNIGLYSAPTNLALWEAIQALS